MYGLAAYHQFQAMLDNISSLLADVENWAYREQNATDQERNVDTLLQDLEMAVGSLVDLARVVDRTD